MKHGKWIAGFITGLFTFPLCALISVSVGQAIVTGRYFETFVVICVCCGAVALIGWLSTFLISKP